MDDPLSLLHGASGSLVGGGSSPQRDPAAAYRKGDLLTATPRRLAELLYGGAIRLCERAVEALEDGDVELAADRLGRARQILRQLQDCVAPLGGAAARRLWDSCEEVHARLLEADHYRRREVVLEAICVLASQRPEWSALPRPPAASRQQRLTSKAAANWLG